MNKDLLESLVNKNLSIEKISNELSVSKSTIRYWLSKFNLKTCPYPKTPHSMSDSRKCSKCQVTKTLDCFFISKKGKIHSYCRECNKNDIKLRKRNFKTQCLEYKGTKSCIICDYNRCESALSFHHLDPAKKEFTISQIKSTELNQKIKEELDKCVVVCSNCHHEVHGGLVRLTGIEPVFTTPITAKEVEALPGYKRINQ